MTETLSLEAEDRLDVAAPVNAVEQPTKPEQTAESKPAGTPPEKETTKTDKPDKAAEENVPQKQRRLVKDAFQEAKQKFEAEQKRPQDAATGLKTRGEDGKFKPVVADNPATPSLTPPQPGEAPKPGENQPLGAPASWSASAKSMFASLPQPVQQEVARLEAERSKVVRASQEETATLRKRYGSVDETFEAHRQRLAARGEDGLSATRRLMAIDAEFDRNPVGVLVALASQRGINLAALGQHQQQTPNSGSSLSREDMDPALVAIRDKVDAMEREKMEEANERKRALTREAETVQVQFKNAKDEAGNALYPHFDELKNEMAFEVSRLIKADQNAGVSPKPMTDYLKAAYEAAVWVNPKIRQQLLDAKAAKDREQEAKSKAEQAAKTERAASASLRGSAGKSPAAARTMRDIIRDTVQGTQG